MDGKNKRKKKQKLGNPIPSNGEIVNYFSSDVDNVTKFIESVHDVWSGPFTLILAVAIIFYHIGVGALFIVLVLLVVFLFNMWVSEKVKLCNVGSIF